MDHRLAKPFELLSHETSSAQQMELSGWNPRQRVAGPVTVSEEIALPISAAEPCMKVSLQEAIYQSPSRSMIAVNSLRIWQSPMLMLRTQFLIHSGVALPAERHASGAPESRSKVRADAGRRRLHAIVRPLMLLRRRATGRNRWPTASRR
jgi:hypothetical protein